MKTKINSILSALIVAVIGVILLVYPGSALEMTARILGIGLLLAGAVTLLISLLQKGHGFSKILHICYGVIEVVIGLFILLKPDFVIASFPVIAGLIMAFEGVMYVITALQIRKGSNKTWLIALILGLVLIILGIVFFSNPFSTMKALVSVLGVSMILGGVTGMIIDIKS